MRPSENRRPNSYYLGSAESPSSDFFQVWLKSSRSGDVVSPPCSPQVRDGLPARSFYLRTLSRTVPAVVLARLVKISASCPNICGRRYSGNFRRSLGADCSAPRALIKELWRRTLFILVSFFKWAPLGPRGRGRRGAVPKGAGLAHTSR